MQDMVWGEPERVRAEWAGDRLMSAVASLSFQFDQHAEFVSVASLSQFQLDQCAALHLHDLLFLVISTNVSMLLCPTHRATRLAWPALNNNNSL